MTMKLLSLDIETGLAKVWTFGLYKPYLGPDHIIEPSRMICFTAQWVNDNDEEEVHFYSEHTHGRPAMLNAIWGFLDDADAIITYNGKKFDDPWIIGELIMEGFPPPSPYAHIDLYQIIKSSTMLMSRKLDYVAQRFLGDAKETHEGLKLWIACAKGDDEAWETMERYARKDTALLKPLYLMLRPFIKSHPNPNLYTDEPDVTACDRCMSQKLKRDGFAYTPSFKFQRYRCLDCGRTIRSKKRLALAATGSVL